MKKNRHPAPSAETITADLMLALGQIVRRLRSEGNPNELNLSQMGALARLERQGPATTADLARMEAMKPQSMKAILAGLEEDGLVERRPHPTDGRQILFVLTAAGAEERRRRGVAKREWMMAALATFQPEEMRALEAAIPLLRRLGNPPSGGSI
ncbi:MarR family winged helix-turn-helix transcriptional regulator [Paraburkholderia susongensis]|uniref:Transcriptional regulator, MarR family n=1 Tax=Paraburkholderia susongensis TaxID=1515439 RepID=A0A1X7LDD5_9BURK|nr:MarR family transcriptional regulator [Paraburkholderia susongensis]SMG51557.1 transcriptional regulator, MarR family [Paraburkholderia susongensis]